MTRGRHSSEEARRQDGSDDHFVRRPTSDTTPGNPLRTSLKGAAPQVYGKPRPQTVSIPHWFWLLLILLAVVFFLLTR